MTEEKKNEEKKTEEKKKISSSGPEQGETAKPRGTAEAAVTAHHAPSKKSSPSAAAKAAAPKSSPPAAAKTAAPKPKSPGALRIRQVKSGICAPVDQKLTLKGLGLRRIRHEVVRPDTPGVRGQIHKVRHLVEIVEGA